MTDTISIPGFSSNNRVPGFYFSLDASKANTATAQRQVLIIGQMLPTSKETPNKAVECSGVSSAIGLYGAGSQIALMVEAYRKIDRNGKLWVLPLADEKGNLPSTGSIQFDGTMSRNGKISLYIGDVLIERSFVSGTSAETVAQSISDLVNSVINVPVTATVNQSTINLTSKNTGYYGNSISINLNLLGEVAGQKTPDGLTISITKMTGGSGNPSVLKEALSNLGQRQFDLFIHPYPDEVSLGIFSDFLDDRWQATVQLYGHAITAANGTYGDITSIGVMANSEYLTIIGTADSPSHYMVWAAQVGAQVAMSIRDNPAIPITGLALKVMPPTDAGTFLYEQRNSLLYDGISTFSVNNNQVMIERLITMYKKNVYGNDDNSYLNIETMLTAAFALQDMRAFLAGQFARCILLPNGSKISSGQKATTAELIAKSCAAHYRTQSTYLWVQNPDQFSRDIKSENVGNGIVKLLMPYQFSDQLFTIAGNCQFTKIEEPN